MTSALLEKESLFDIRGGSTMSHVCEVCGDPMPKDAVTVVCTECKIENEEGEQ